MGHDGFPVRAHLYLFVNMKVQANEKFLFLDSLSSQKLQLCSVICQIKFSDNWSLRVTSLLFAKSIFQIIGVTGDLTTGQQSLFI